jgi:hypothetical protein
MAYRSTTSRPDDRVPLAAGLDVFFVALFVAVGRRNHDEDPGIAGLVETAAPFLIGLVVAWILVRAWRTPTDLASGVWIWLITVAGGMLLRRTVFDRGTAVSFVIVATVFLGMFLLGWRAIVTWIDRRRVASAP